MPTSSMTSASIRFPSKQREPLLIISFALVSMQNNIHDFHSMGGSYRTGQIQHRQLPAWSRRKPCSFLPADSCRLAGGTSLSSCCQCTLPHRLAPLSMSRWDWSVSSHFLRTEGNFFSIAGADNRPLQIVPVHFRIGITELAERVFCRVSIGVSLADLDYSIFRHDLTKEGIAGAGVAAMVSDFQDRCRKVVSGVQNIRLSGSFSIARKRKDVFPYTTFITMEVSLVSS